MSNLEDRNKAKKKKPSFNRQDHNLKGKFVGTWRKPRGMHSKQRRNKDGHGNMPSIGYGTPSDVRGLDSVGMKKCTVNYIKDLANLDPKKDVVIIASAVGNKKKLSILEEAKKKGLKVKSVRDVEGFISKVKKVREESKKERASKKDKRSQLKQEALKIKEEKEKKEEEEKKGAKDEPVK